MPSMINILLASHGTLAEGMKNSVEIIMGEKKNIDVITAYTNNIDLEEEVQNFLNDFNVNDNLIVVTDLLGGSVNNLFIELLNKYDFHLITGMNLPLVLQLLLLKGDDELETNLNEIILNSQSGVCLCNELIDQVIKEKGEF
ncbi:PTS sugar transporter subunit IIA [Amphibacillus sp. Q70]|uniref:PTS sugar transporter subunit IIA n=1 Tax=Amphibacillus sp. Q70 TaxID=3453416 RepID=UPI003F840617